MASLWTKDGSLVLCSDGTTLAYQDTCPCTTCAQSCPCSTYPPASWPCGGLYQTYTLAYRQTLTAYANYSACSGTVICTTYHDYSYVVTANAQCSWYGSTTQPTKTCVIQASNCWAEDQNSANYATLNWNSGTKLWQIVFGMPGANCTATKCSALPSGTYADVSCCYTQQGCNTSPNTQYSVTRAFSNISIT